LWGQQAERKLGEDLLVIPAHDLFEFQETFLDGILSFLIERL